MNKTRGSGFPEISLDDLADEFFGTKGFDAEEESRSNLGRTGRSSRRGDDERFRMETESSRRRGRSVSKKGNFVNGDGSRQQRRSISVARRRSADLEVSFLEKLACFGKLESAHFELLFGNLSYSLCLFLRSRLLKCFFSVGKIALCIFN